jgi:hypothetical protein
MRLATARRITTRCLESNAAAGTYNINITTQDTTGAPNHTFAVAMTLAQDFVVTTSTASQSVTAGQTSGPYNLTILPVGASFNGAVTLACSAGMPAQAQCIFNPSTAVTPGSAAVDVVMSISTTAKRGSLQLRSSRASVFLPYALWLLLPGMVLGCGRLNTCDAKRKRVSVLSITLLGFVMVGLSSCGGVSTGGTTPPGGNQPVIYNITVTGTSAGTAPDAGQSVQVILVVN